MTSSNASKTGLWNRMQPQWNMLTALVSVKEFCCVIKLFKVGCYSASCERCTRDRRACVEGSWDASLMKKAKTIDQEQNNRDFPRSYWFCHYPNRHLRTLETCSYFEPVKARHFVFVREWHTTIDFSGIFHALHVYVFHVTPSHLQCAWPVDTDEI